MKVTIRCLHICVLFTVVLISSVFLLMIPCRLVIIAGDISPIDVITHVPILCEDANIPYIYVPSKEVIVCFIPSFLLNIYHEFTVVILM